MSDNTSHRARLERVRKAAQERGDSSNSRLGIYIAIGALGLFALGIVLFIFNLNAE